MTLIVLEKKGGKGKKNFTKKKYFLIHYTIFFKKNVNLTLSNTTI